MTTPPRSPWRPEVVDIRGRFVDASNATLLATTNDGVTVVYKPDAGQRPLWDFDAATLPRREILTYEVSRLLGLSLVPETVLANGPYGPGSVQRYVDHDEDFDPVPLVRQADPALWPIAALDVITNNADRKLGHILKDATGLRAIDHGLTFHAEPKLRTVLWCFAGRRWPESIVAAAEGLLLAVEHRPRRFIDVLDDAELASFLARIRSVIEGSHPDPPDDRPPVPWPPY